LLGKDNSFFETLQDVFLKNKEKPDIFQLFLFNFLVRILSYLES